MICFDIQCEFMSSFFRNCNQETINHFNVSTFYYTPIHNGHVFHLHYLNNFTWIKNNVYVLQILNYNVRL